MNYQETVEWMFQQLPMFQQIGTAAYKKDLHNIQAFASYLGNPEKQIRCIHIAGTNGKGSTSSLIASVLQESGYKVGLYTSPHLKDYRERIRINGDTISEDFVVQFIKNSQEFLNQNFLSFFEMSVGMAFDYFAKEKVDYAVIEVGLGGRLDSTNIITPILSVITNIGWDHQNLLGDTLPKIAFEKAGIIKPNIPLVIGEYHPETIQVFREKAGQYNAPIYFAFEQEPVNYACPLQGNYQKHNFKTVQLSFQVLQQMGLQINKESIERGFANVIKNTGLLGRWQVLQNAPKIVCDTAHNVNGLQYTMQQLQLEAYDQLHLVLGFVSDKDLGNILSLFPKNAKYYIAKPNVPRGLDVDVLHQQMQAFGLVAESFSSIPNAFLQAKQNAQIHDLVYVGGSTFVVAEII
ncbi:MAG: bifunctional folylpolyglutamate synthase/dihydrofolate synthase [Flavobacterium sp.]